KSAGLKRPVRVRLPPPAPVNRRNQSSLVLGPVLQQLHYLTGSNYQSLRRRRESLDSRLRELELLQRAGQTSRKPQWKCRNWRMKMSKIWMKHRTANCKKLKNRFLTRQL